MIVVDVETTGIDPNASSIVSIGAIDFLNPKDQFSIDCRIWDGAHVENAALNVNGFSLDEIRDPAKPTEGEAVVAFYEWAKTKANHTIAGQNPFFDLSFIMAGARRHHLGISFPNRIIDQHSICYYHMARRGLTPPLENKRTNLNSDTIMTYVGIPTEPKPHIALNGATWEAEAFHRLFFDKGLFIQFVNYSIPWITDDVPDVPAKT